MNPNGAPGQTPAAVSPLLVALFAMPVLASTRIYKGSLAALTPAGYLTNASADASLRVVGCGVSNKGVALYNGKVLRTTIDAHVTIRSSPMIPILFSRMASVVAPRGSSPSRPTSCVKQLNTSTSRNTCTPAGPP